MEGTPIAMGLSQLPLLVLIMKGVVQWVNVSEVGVWQNWSMNLRLAIYKQYDLSRVS